jgi:ligand-binding sensor domain-containing protein
MSIFSRFYKFFFEDSSTPTKARNFVVVLFLGSCLPLFSQSNNSDYVVDYITTKQGLSHNYVSSIVSDALNLKWIGTENGITKFNGFDFEYIKPSEAYKELLNENIEVLFIDKSSNLWIGTKSGGLSFIDTEHNEVKNLNYLIDLEGEGDLRITSISEDKNGHIWVGTWQDGLFMIDFKNNKLIKHLEYSHPIYFVKPDFKGNVWFSYGNKVLRYETEIDEITAYPLPGQVSDLLSDKKRNKIWIALSGSDTKLYSFDYENQVIDEIGRAHV